MMRTSPPRFLPLLPLMLLGCQTPAPPADLAPSNTWDDGWETDDTDPGDTDPLDSGPLDTDLIDEDEAFFTPPEVSAGPNVPDALVGTLVPLDGRATNPVGPDDALTLSWSILQAPPGSTEAFIHLDDRPQAALYVDAPGTFIVSFRASNGRREASDNARVTVVNPNRPPVADPGPDQDGACLGTVVQLDGTGSSDPDGDPITWHWELRGRPAGSSAALQGASDPATANRPTFIPDVAGLYTIELRVQDEPGAWSTPRTVGVTARQCEGPP